MRIRPSTASTLARSSLLARAPPRPPTLPSEVLRICQKHLPAAHIRRHEYSTSSSSSPSAVPASQLQFGQPVHETHPHILAPGELTPSITAQEYHDRRAAFAASLPPNALAILPSSTIKWRSGAVFYPFRQDSNFLYLTGFAEPESLAAIQKTGPDPDDFLFHLYVRPKNPALEQWSGPWSGTQAAEDVFNADIAGDIAQAERHLAPLLASASKLYTDAADLRTLFPNTPLPSSPPTAPLKPLLNALRILKSPAELSALRHAGRTSGRALTNAMRRAWTDERALAAHLDHAFTAAGLSGPAYIPVVAGGPRARLIHYVLNNQALHPGDLVLVDAGGEYGTYVSDITRTWPVNGVFTPPQRDLYEAVLRVQRAGVALCRADAGRSLDQIHRATEAALKTELSALGFDMARSGALDALFAHHVGHYVGLDVHDCPGYGRNVALKKGMCVTIEPGVYVPDDEQYPKHFRGMGIRIEDSVAVDDEGPVVLTVEAVKEVVDIEALRR